MIRPFGLPRRLRLRSKQEITRVFRQGRYHRLGWLHVKTLPSDRDHSRFLVSVRKAIGAAPVRNRIKRVVREAIRLNRGRLTRSHDVCIFITNRPEEPVRLSTVEREIQHLFERLSGESQSVGSPR